MSQSERIKKVEEYVAQLGRNFNVIYKKVADSESKAKSLEADLSRTKSEIEALKAENQRLRENAVSKAEYDEFMNRLIASLKELLSTTTQGEISQ